MALERINEEEKGIRRLVRGILTRPRPELVERWAFGARFLVIRAPLFRGEPDWRGIEELAGRLGSRMLLPDDLQLPEDSLLEPVSCPAFQRRVLLATACELVARTRIPIYRRVLGLLDPAGDCADMLPVLLGHYALVRVSTRNLPVYRDAAERMMDEMGAPVLVGGEDLSLADCLLALAPGEDPEPAVFPLDCPVLAGEGIHIPPGQETLASPEIAPTEELTALTPPGISPHRFAAALHDYCGVDIAWSPARILHNHRHCALSEVANQLMRRAEVSRV